jgi:hypothetical protein
VDRHLQRVCLNLGIAFPVVFFAGWGLIAGFLLPMPAPHDTAEQVVAFFSHDSLRIGIGLIIAVAAAPLQGAMAAVVGVYLRRSAGANSALAYTQMLMGGVQVIFALVPCIMWAALAFRAGAHDPDTMLALNDFAWLFFVGGFSPPLVQSLCVALVVLRDRRPEPVLPRWVGYYNLWCALLFVPGGICLIAQRGPFAWNGILAFWIPATVFGGWFFVMYFALRRAIEADDGAEVADLQPAA